MIDTPIALVRPVSSSLPRCTLTHKSHQPIDLPLARLQHADYTLALETLGAHVRWLPPIDGAADAVFVEDAAVVFYDTAVIARLARPSLPEEIESLENALAAKHTIGRIAPPGTLEGGDVILRGSTVYVGASGRTNGDGIAQLTRIAKGLGARVVEVGVHGCLHLKTGCSLLPDGAFLVNADWIDTASLSVAELVPVPESEPWGANTLTIGTTVLLPNAFPATRSLLEARGLAIHPVVISEFLKAEGGVTCLSVVY